MEVCHHAETCNRLLCLCVAFLPMSFDIVEHVCELPYLVLAVLFPLLPADHSLLYRECHVPEIRDLARAQRWREVRVCERPEGPFEFSLPFFDAKVSGNVPPPCRIGRVVLEYEKGTDARVFAWTNYLEQYAVSVALDVDYSETFLAAQPCILHAFHNLRALSFVDGLHAVAENITLAELRLPQGLRELNLTGMCWEWPVSYRDLVIPHAVSLLTMEYPFDTPDELPMPPRTLLKLVLRGYRPTDMGLLVLRLPCGLTALFVHRPGDRPAAVLRLDLERFPRLLTHNLDVVDGEVVCHAWMKKKGESNYELIADDFTDFSRCTLPPGIEQLEVTSVVDTLPEHCLDAVLRSAADVALLTLSSVELTQCNVTALHVPKLTTLLVYKCSAIPECSFQFATNVTRLLMVWCTFLDAVPPFLLKCTRLEVLDLSGSHIHAEGLTGSEFPASLRRLILLKARGTPGEATTTDVDAVPEPHLVDFRSLVHLEHLDVLGCKVTDWSRWRFPQSLKELDVSNNRESPTISTVQLPLALREFRVPSCRVTDIRALRLPLSLRKVDLLSNKLGDEPGVYGFWEGIQELDMQRCGITDLSRWFFPKSLRKLDLLENKIGKSPEGCTFPDGLECLCVENCGITDLTNWCFPQSLKELYLRGNNFAVLADYAWPCECRVVFGYRLDELMQGQLSRAHPCAVFER